MEQKTKITGTDWSLVDKMVRIVYPNVYRQLSVEDIQEIIKLSEQGILIKSEEVEEDDGDLDFPIMEIMTAASLGFMTIQTFLQWDKKNKTNSNVIPTKDRVSRMLEDLEFFKNNPTEIKNELKRRKESINSAYKKLFPEENDSE